MTSPPLVMHVIHQLAMGGMENGLVNLLNRLPRGQARHAVVCIEDHTDFARRIQREDVEIIDMHRARTGVQRLRLGLGRLFAERRPAIVHSRNQSGLDALLPARVAGVPVRIHGEHGWDVDDLGGTRFKPALLRRLHIPLVTHYVTVSGDLAHYLERRVGVRRSRISHICNGVDTERFAPPELRGTLRGSEPWPEGFADADAVVFTAVGRAQPVKDQATLLRAFARARDASPEFAARARLAVIGDGPLLGDLHALQARLELGDSTWLPGALDAVPKVLAGSDVFVLPSLGEGISNTLLEALATGLPVLATRVGGNPELLDDGVTGTLFEAGDEARLEALLLAYFDNPLRRVAESHAARDAAVTRFSIDTMVDAYAQLYARFGVRGDKC